jgi:hypothetical protein
VHITVELETIYRDALNVSTERVVLLYTCIQACACYFGRMGLSVRDGGWGWCIACCTFLVHLIVGGVAFSGGVYYLKLIEKFKRDEFESAWTGSLLMGMTAIGGASSGLCCVASSMCVCRYFQHTSRYQSWLPGDCSSWWCAGRNRIGGIHLLYSTMAYVFVHRCTVGWV